MSVPTEACAAYRREPAYVVQRFAVTEEIADHTPERMTFKLPRELVA